MRQSEPETTKGLVRRHDCGLGVAQLEFVVGPDPWISDDHSLTFFLMSYRSKPLRRYAGSICSTLFILFVISLPSSFAQDLKASHLPSLHGTVRDPQGKGAADATLRLQSQTLKQTLITHTDTQGGYSFPSVREGIYALRLTMNGYEDAEVRSLALAPGKDKKVDLMLGAQKTGKAAASPQGTPRFFDEPQFTVSGVTDTTNLGGHGSDTVVRTRETLAKETVALAQTLANRGSSNFAATERSLRSDLDHNPGSFDANHRLGRLLLESNRPGDAILFLQRAAEIKPEEYDNAYALALANAQAGNLELAREQIRTQLGVRNSPELHHLLADVQEKLGDPLEAAREYQRAAVMDPSEPFLFDWASELLLHHAPEPALQVFTRGSSMYPKSGRMLIGLGAALFAHGSNEQAVRTICRASDLDPNDPIPSRFLGKMQRAETVPSNEVVERLKRYFTLQPQSPEANYYYAVAVWKLRKPGQDRARGSQVAALLSNAVQLEPKFAAADLQLGIVHAELGDYSAAISDYKRAIEADQQIEEAHYRLGQAYRHTGQVDKAKDELRIYEQLARESAQRVDRERHEIRQLVYTLRDQPAPHAQ